MLSRAEILDRFGLPVRDTFEIEPHRDDLGIWRIKISHPGDPAILMSLGHAKRLADTIVSADAPLAEQIEGCRQAAGRYAQKGD